MNTIQENLINDIRELLEKHNKQSLTLSDINTKIPEVLSNILAAIEQPDCPILNHECVGRKYPVVINSVENHFTETQVSELRSNNSANMFLDMPKRTLTINFPGLNKTFNYEELPYSSQKILLFGMTRPGEFLNEDNFWSRDTLKRYIFTTRQLLGDCQEKRLLGNLVLFYM